MNHKKHITTLTNTSVAVTAACLLCSIGLLGVSLVAAIRSFSFITACFCLLMVFAVFVAIRMTKEQSRIGVDFYEDHLEFQLDDTPIILTYQEIAGMELLNDGEPPKRRQKVLAGAQLVFHLKDGGLRIVPVPKLRKARGQRILAEAAKRQEREAE